MKGVSICIPCYNQTQYLRQTLLSVSEQTYPLFEVIVSDDSTIDDVKNLVSDFSSSINVKYIRNSPSLGPAANWNQCIRLANNDWIKILHHDDWFTSKDSITKFMDFAIDDYGLIFSASVSKNEREKTLTEHFPGKLFLDDISKNPEVLFCGNLIGPPSAVLFNKSKNIFFDERMKWLVDIDFYINLIHKSGGKFFYIDETLITSVSYAEHNVTNNCNNAETELYEYFLLFEKLLRLGITNGNVVERLRELVIKYDVSRIEDLKPYLKEISFSDNELSIVFNGLPKKSLIQKLKKIIRKGIG
ncbi:MAG: glycosyltransferase family 2 protein [Bacteroidota bacterium]